MAQLIAVIGNVGVGKTTFAQQLCAAASYSLACEDHASRAFHDAFARGDHSLVLANQIDHLLARAEQERTIRAGNQVGVVDGGLEQDLFVFSRFFAHRKLLPPSQLALCQRLYHFVRQTLPPPDLVIHLHAPIDVLVQRYTHRQRPVEVIQVTDIPLLEHFVHDWLDVVGTSATLAVDASADDPGFACTLAALREPIQRMLGR